MNFLVTSSPAAASVAGAIPRLPLPAAGQLAFAWPELRTGRSLPPVPGAAAAGRPHLGQLSAQAQHRAQCRSLCRSKANF